MIKYDPNNELSTKELEQLPFEEQLEYLDKLSEHLRGIPLPESPRNKKIIKIMSDKGYI